LPRGRVGVVAAGKQNSITYVDRGSGTPTTTGTTWASATNAVDGTPPANPATYATMTSTTSGAVATIEISGYDFSTVIPGTATLPGNLITVSLRHFENNTGRFASVAFQPFDGATALGVQQTASLNASAVTAQQTFACTMAQLRSATFKVVVTITGAASTQSRVFSIDHVDVSATYAP
jgi:hypothetical protein